MDAITVLCLAIYVLRESDHKFSLQLTFLEKCALLLWTGVNVITETRPPFDQAAIREYDQRLILRVTHSGLTFVICYLIVVATVLLTVESSASQTRPTPTPRFVKLLIFSALSVGGILFALLPGLRFTLQGTSPTAWIVNFLLKDNCYRLCLAMCWIGLVLFFTYSAQLLATHSSTPKFVNRKIFHLLMVMIISPGLFIQDLFSFTILAQGVALSAFLILETFRVCVLLPYSFGDDAISSYYSLFLDKGESKRLWISSNISLLIGCSFPAFLWAHWFDLPQCTYSMPDSTTALYPCGFGVSGNGVISEDRLRLLKSLRPLLPHLGWITVGVGDSAAALVGSRFGKHKWRGTSRTVEGSCAMFISMLSVSLCVLSIAGGNDWPLPSASYIEHLDFKTIWPLLVTLALTSLCEAFATENDNLVLPLFSVILYVATVSVTI
jgi:dolichol kinase